MKKATISSQIPKTFSEWKNELKLAFLDAKEAIPFGIFVGTVIKKKDLFHLAPDITLKFRKISGSKLRQQASDAALASYVANLDKFPEIMKYPEISFSFCYFAAHFGLGLVKAEDIDLHMQEIEKNIQGFIKEMNNSKSKKG
jgi:hypothetical protein